MKKLRMPLVTVIAVSLLAGSAVGVTAQDEAADPMAPAAFSGLAGGDQPMFTVDPETGLTTVVIESFELTDSRASGTWTQVEDVAVLKDGKLEYVAGRSSVRLVNDGGAWVGTHRLLIKRYPKGKARIGVFAELIGEGGYEGLSLFFVETVNPKGKLTSNAFIVPTDLVPAAPPPPAAE